jgi:thiol-disulfide isomerase/thioredoxin/outer membrane lipoprotein-sorting protein
VGLALVLGVLVCGAASADEPKVDPKADQVMTRVAAFYSGLDSYTDRTHVDVSVMLGGHPVAFVVESKVTYAKPDRILIESKSERPEGNGCLVYDGDTYWVYRADLGQYTKVKSLEDEEMSEAPFAGNVVASILSEKDVVWPPGEDNKDMVAGVYGGKETVSGIETEIAKLIMKDGYIKLWVDPKGMVRQAVLEIDLGGGISLKTKEVHEDIVVNPQIGPTQFALAIPEGAIAVQAFGKEPKLEEAMAPSFPQVEGLIANGEEAPDFSLQDLGGNAYALSDLSGKVVLLDFWATWCGPCRMEMPEIQKIHDDLKGKGLVVLGVNDESDVNAVKQFLSDSGYTYPTVRDPKGETYSAYRISAIPAIYIITKDGKVASSLIGYSPDRGDEIREILKKLGIE